MIWISSFFLISLIFLKESLFLRSLFDLSSSSLFIFSLVPLNFMSIRFLISFYETSVNRTSHLLLFSLILIPVGIRFLVERPIWFLILLELSVLPTCYAIMFLSKDRDKLISAILILSINLVGSFPFLVYSIWFSSSFQDQFFLNSTSSDSFLLIFGFILILCSKLPVAFFHFWLTKAHVAARACVSIFLARILLKLGSFGLIKFIRNFSSITTIFSHFIFPWCLVFSLLFSIIIVRFVDIKMLVALSSVLHISMMVPLISLGESLGILSILLMIMGHGLVSYFFFIIVRIIYEKRIRRSSQYNKGRESSNGGFFLILFAVSFLNMGVPPILNFIRELLVCSSLFSYSTRSTLVFMSSMVIGIFFCMFLISKITFDRKSSAVAQEIESRVLPFFWRFLRLLLFVPLIY